MSLSGAERQKRYRDKLLATVRGADLGERAREAIDAAITVVWALHARNPNVVGPQEIHADLAAFRAFVAYNDMDGAAEAAHKWVSGVIDSIWWQESPATDEEIAAAQLALAVLDAALLKHVPCPPKFGGRKRKA